MSSEFLMLRNRVLERLLAEARRQLSSGGTNTADVLKLIAEIDTILEQR